MMHKEFSPEEKLLNLIKRKKNKIPPEKNNLNKSMPEEAPAPKQKEGIRSSFLLDLNRIIRFKNIRILNIVLFSMLIGIILYFIIDIFLIPTGDIALFEEEKVLAPTEIEEIEIKPYSHYSKELNKEVFKPLIKEEFKEARQEVPVEELMGNLALLGIVSGDNPQAIIEDKVQKKSFFLREGQSAGGIFLKRIENDAVTVIYKGEEFNLNL